MLNITMTEEPYIETMEFLQKLWNAGVCRMPNVTESGSYDNWGTPSATFDQGVEVAMTHRAGWQYGGMNNNGVDWGFVPYPWGSNVTCEGDYTTLSSGMTAKMKIAVTMARDARVWMLDEPFNGIDLLARDEIRACILEHFDPDKLLLISSHLVEEMEAIADTAVFIRKGQLIEVRNLEEMRSAEGKSMADRYREIFAHMEV